MHASPARLHPLTGHPLEPIGFRLSGAPIWPIMGGSQGAVESPSAGGQAPAPGQGGNGTQGGTQPPPQGTQPPADHGFPANTAVSDMTPEQQVAYWKTQARKHEDRAKGRDDYDQIKTQLAELQSKHQTESEKAINEAKAAGKAEAIRDVNAGAVAALLDGSLRMRGRTDQQIAETLKYVNTDAFVTNGVPDTQAILAYAESLGGPVTGRAPDFGAGNRGRQQSLSGRDAGLAEAQRRGYVKS